MILKSLKNFKDSIEKSPALQLDFIVCEFLRKTPMEVYELEKQGLLTLEQKIFIQAGVMWKREKFGGCPFFG